MADPLPDDETGTPRWVKVFGVIALVVVLLFVILLLTVGPAAATALVATWHPASPNRARNSHDHDTPPAQVRAHRACHVLGRLAGRGRCLPRSRRHRSHQQDAQTVRAAYLVMEPAARFVLVPLAFASLLTGLVQSLGTTWGLFRHYWVLFKLLINVFATIVLLIYMPTLGYLAGVAADPTVDLGGVRNSSPTLHAALALLVLLVATVLSVYKPQGMTRYGRRKLS